MDLTEAEDIKKRWQEYMEELYKKDLHNPDNHDGVIIHLEWFTHQIHILECELKWALESITTNKASGGDGIPVELFQILKDGAVKVLHSICQQIGKLSSGHRTGKGQFSFQSQRKAMPKNAQTEGEGESGMIWGMALKHVYYHVRNELPVYVQDRIQDAWGWCTGMI